MADRKITYSVEAEVTGADDVRDLATEFHKLDQTDARPTADVDVEGEERVEDLRQDLDALDDERVTPEVVPEVDSRNAQRVEEFMSVFDELDAMRATPEVDTTDAVAELSTLDVKAADTDDQLSSAGAGAFVDAIGGIDGVTGALSALGGPGGEIAATASQFAGLGQVAAQSMQPSSALAAGGGPWAIALAGVGLAVGGAIALWKRFGDEAKKARERVDEWADALRELDAGDAAGELDLVTEKAISLIEETDGLADALLGLGGTGRDLASDINGGTSPALELARERMEQFNEATRNNSLGTGSVEFRNYAESIGLTADELVTAHDNARTYLGVVEDQSSSLDKAREATDNERDALDQLATAQDKAREATERANEQFDAMRTALRMKKEASQLQTDVLGALNTVNSGAVVAADDIYAIQTSILDVAEFAGLTPIEVNSIVEDVERGDWLSVYNAVQAMANKTPVRVDVKLGAVDPELWRLSHPTGGNPGTAAAASSRLLGASPVLTVAAPARAVTINVRAGVIGSPDDVMRAVIAAEKRADRLVGSRR